VSLLRNLFEGRPGASGALQWLRRHHRGDGDGGNYGGSGEPVLDDVGLLDWLYCLRDAAATGAYRASLGEEHSVGEEGGQEISVWVYVCVYMCALVLLLAYTALAN